MDRALEARDLLQLTVAEFQKQCGNRLVVLPNVDELHRHFADEVAGELIARNAKGQPTRLILPVGPVAQYPLLAERVASERISMENTWLFFMDEYCDDLGRSVTEDHPLSFARIARREFLDRLPAALGPPRGQVVFPSDRNIHDVGSQIERVGGIDTCYGGIGMHGHVAFNEPEPGVSLSDPRCVLLNDVTRTINCLRAGVGGNLVAFPRRAVTLGMQQILNARRIRLYCRNGIPFDWANLVLRLSLLGSPGDDYPVTHLRHHNDFVVISDQETASRPKSLL